MGKGKTLLVIKEILFLPKRLWKLGLGYNLCWHAMTHICIKNSSKNIIFKIFSKVCSNSYLYTFSYVFQKCLLWKKEIVVGNKFFTRVLSLYNILYHENILSIILYLLTIYYIISHENIPHEDFPDWLKS